MLDQTFSNGDLAVDYLNNWSTQIGDADDASIKYDLLFDGQALAQQQFTLKMGVAGLSPTMTGPQSFSAVPEPNSASLLLSLAAGMLLTRRQRKQTQQQAIRRK